VSGWTLREGWTLWSTEPGAEPGAPVAPISAMVPGTVAQARGLGLDGDPELEARDWWYRCTFDDPGGAEVIAFDGLATLAEVWLNGAPILQSQNMFRRHQVAVTLRPSANVLVIAFRSLQAALKGRRPRPRWKTALVHEQKLRWIRTSLLGRIPAWSPPLPVVGPWRQIRLETRPALVLTRLDTTLDGDTGVLTLSAHAPGAHCVRLHLGEHHRDLPVADGVVAGELRIPDVAPWWPHTHGPPTLHQARAEVIGPQGRTEVDLGRIGFRTVEIDRTNGAFQLGVNGRPVFARGACWTAEDPWTLDGTPGTASVMVARAAGMGLNMIRIGGTMTWPSDELLSACDEHGVLLWQDCMFANMDYPFDDPVFRGEVEAELADNLGRLARHPCTAVVCGGSEVAQQASMLGLPEETWKVPFFAEELAPLVAQHTPGVPTVPNSPWGGPLPFHVGAGVAHYFGVGAYKRPLSDARGVRFSSECLGFSNVPDEDGLRAVFGGRAPQPHLPAWKAGVPRDAGAGWDFEDIRDHYLAQLWGVDPVALRSLDPRRYLALSRAVTGELMHRVFAEWRRPGGGGAGGLVWFLRDLRPGAGWGIFDAEGRPKAAAWALKRAWATRAVLLTEEGLDGYAVHVHNEAPERLDGEVELLLLRDATTPVAQGRRAIAAPAQTAHTLSADQVLGRFTDSTHAYRFGPPGHDVVIARLWSGDTLLHEDVAFPGGHQLRPQPRDVLQAEARRDEDVVIVELSSTALLQGLHATAKGWRPDDDHLHLTPGSSRSIRFTSDTPGAPFKAVIGALNLQGTLTVRG